MIAKDRHQIGEYRVNHKDVILKTPVGSDGYDTFVENIDTVFNYEVGYIPAGAEHRPDLISDVFYGTVAYWWLILLCNGISDPFEELNVGDQILLPIM